MGENEAYSRAVIDKQLEAVGWNVTDLNQVVFEDHGSVGRADYVLKDKNGQPIALIEAKSPAIDPYTAKQQAYNYAETQYTNKIDFIFLANDKLTYFWDYRNGGDATVVPAFFSQEDLTRKRQGKLLANTEPLLQRTVEEDYFNDIDTDIKLRPYQIAAYNAIAKDYDAGKRSFLLEMATGTGKTVLASLIISKFIRTNQARSVLFIVDRIELARQTKGTFERLLGKLSAVATYWGGAKKNILGANIVVATIQSLIIHGKDVFTPGYFDLIIHDEAHRSIYSPEARAAVDYFIGTTKIGLTATPKDFLKNVDVEKLGEDDPRALDARIQRDTYKYFGCPQGQATYRYTIQDGVDDGFLIKPSLHKMTSVLTQEALSEEGIKGEGDYEDENYKIAELEKKVFVPERNKLMMKEFLEYAEKTPQGEIGKTIIFAVNQRHATNLEKILNELKPEFHGRFAQTITSRIRDAHDLARDFRNLDNVLPRIAVSVDMLTTGYDAPEVQNIVLARPVFEPTLYQQIKGRGTRLCPEISKQRFVIFDFCGVCEYFDEKYDWEAPLPVPREPGTTEGPGPIEPPGPVDPPIPPQPPIQPPVITRIDVVDERDFIVYGPEGDTVDRQMYQDQWTKKVKEFAEREPMIVMMAQDESKDDEFQQILQTEVLNQPDYYFNEDNLVKTYGVLAPIKDFFLSALGVKPLPKREDQIREWQSGMLSKYGQANNGGSQKKYLMTKLLVNEAVSNPELCKDIEKTGSLSFLMQPPFNQDFSAEEWLNTFGKEELVSMAYDIKSNKILKY